MNKVRILVITVVVLLASNIFFLVKMLSHPNPPEHKNPKEVIIEKLDFDDEQVKAYEKLIDAHRSKVMELDGKILDAKGGLYLNIGHEHDAMDKHDLEVLQKHLVELEELHYQHFLDIKKICRPNQLDKFEELSHELPKLFSPPKGPRRRE